MHMYRTDLASISELNHYALSSAWQQFNDSSEKGMGILWHGNVEGDSGEYVTACALTFCLNTPLRYSDFRLKLLQLIFFF